MSVLSRIAKIHKFVEDPKGYVYILGDLAMKEFKDRCEEVSTMPTEKPTPADRYDYMGIPVICEYLKQDRNSIRLYKVMIEMKETK